MADRQTEAPADERVAHLAEVILEELARQFPVCMASDEFHFFPQARSNAPDWSRWDDFSPDALSEMAGQLAQWKRQLDRLVSPASSSAQLIDTAMLHRVLATLDEQLAHVRFHETQPTFYLTVAGIGLADAIDAGPQALEARLRHLPDFIDQSRRYLGRMPRLFRDLGMEMLTRQQMWLRSLSMPDNCRSPLEAALHRLAGHLTQASVDDDFHLPTELYERVARDHVGCRLAPDEIARELTQEVAETRAILEEAATAIAPGESWQTVVDNLPTPPVSTGGIADVYRNTISELAQHCCELGLFTAGFDHRYPVTVAPIPDYMRPVRSNAAYSMPPIHPPHGGTFFISERIAGRPIPADYRLLTAHETYPGHHLLDTCRWRHQRLVRRHIEFPIFYEGWASFAEELMFDTGFFSGTVDRLLMAKRRFWRALRGLADVHIHVNRRSLNDVASMLAAEGLAPQRAMAMVRRYSLKPGYQLAYTIGRRRFQQLYSAGDRPQMEPAAFARLVLEQGEIGFRHLEQKLQQGG